MCCSTLGLSFEDRHLVMEISTQISGHVSIRLIGQPNHILRLKIGHIVDQFTVLFYR